MKQIQKAKENTEWNVFIDGNQVTVENRGFKKNVNLGGSHRYLEERNYDAIKLVNQEDIGLPLSAKFIYQSKTCHEYLIVVSNDDTIYNLNTDAFEEVE